MRREENKKGEIISFYSFKGGTGRTMTLANISVLVSRLSNNVLLIDWDLEAPGLHKYFLKFIELDEQSFKIKPGLIDLFLEIERIVDTFNRNLNEREIKSVLENIDLSNFITETTIEGIKLIKAGAFDKGYINNINTFDWQDLFSKCPNFFGVFAEYLKERFDIILIDSRTGFTDTSGICTMLLPEKLCLVFTTNDQSLEGVLELASTALEFRLDSNDFRPLKIYPVPSRVELAEKELRDIWRKGSPDGKKGFQKLFEQIFNAYYGFENSDLTTYFDSVQIHHEPRYSYGEEIAVLNETYTDRLSLTDAYTSLFQSLIINPNIYIDNFKNTNDNKRIRVYLSFDIKDVDKIVDVVDFLKKRMTDLDFINTDDPLMKEFATLEDRISNADVFIPFITKNYLQPDSQDLIDYETKNFLKIHVSKGNRMILPIVIGIRQSEVPPIFNSLQNLFVEDWGTGTAATIAEKVQDAVISNKQIYQNTNIDTNNLLLSDAEIQFLKLASSDMTYKEIAIKMKMSERLIDHYREILFEKMKVQSRVGLVLEAIRKGLVEL